MKKIVYACVMSALLGLGACSTTSETAELTAEEIYQKGYTSFQKEEYEQAAEYFDEVEKKYPYSIWAERAQIMAAYAFYQKNNYDDALLVLDRFIQLHPGNKNTPYAFYLKGLCYFEQMSDSAREQSMTENAKMTFDELLARYPNSIYVRDAQAKMAVMSDRLAAQEMGVGRYYLKHEDIIPALNRFKRVVENYPDTKQVPEAYYRLGAGYIMLGMRPMAQDVFQVLKSNYPDNEWTHQAMKLIEK